MVKYGEMWWCCGVVLKFGEVYVRFSGVLVYFFGSLVWCGMVQ